ncbi:MAG: hypothetical protein ACK4SY_03915 [Pyrobaculum sp.]
MAYIFGVVVQIPHVAPEGGEVVEKRPADIGGKTSRGPTALYKRPSPRC